MKIFRILFPLVVLGVWAWNPLRDDDLDIDPGSDPDSDPSSESPSPFAEQQKALNILAAQISEDRGSTCVAPMLEDIVEKVRTSSACGKFDIFVEGDQVVALFPFFGSV